MLYLAMAGVHYEGSGPVGIFNTLEEAKAFAVKDCDKHGYDYSSDNYWFVNEWDTEKQEGVRHWDFDKESRAWKEFVFRKQT